MAIQYEGTGASSKPQKPVKPTKPRPKRKPKTTRKKGKWWIATLKNAL